MPLCVLGREEDDMIIFVLTYAVLALLGLSLVGTMNAQTPKPSAKVAFNLYPQRRDLLSQFDACGQPSHDSLQVHRQD